MKKIVQAFLISLIAVLSLQAYAFGEHQGIHAAEHLYSAKIHAQSSVDDGECQFCLGITHAARMTFSEPVIVRFVTGEWLLDSSAISVDEFQHFRFPEARAPPCFS